jgi:hypothetical protein
LFVLSLLVTAMVIVVPIVSVHRLYSWYKEEHTIHQIKHKKPIDPHYKKAMEELDDMDRLMGLLPPKPLPVQKPKPSYGKNYHYTTITNSPFETLTPIQQEFVKRTRANAELKQLAKDAQRRFIEQNTFCLTCNKHGIHAHMMNEVNSDAPF